MTNLYIIRHGQTTGNSERRFQGHIDLPLTPLGQQQAQQVALRFANIKLDAIYSSPLSRAAVTAEAIAAHHSLTVTKLDGLKEINGGAFEGQAFEDIHKLYPTEFQQFLNEPHLFTGVGGGESMQQLLQRVSSTLAEIISDNMGGNIVVVSHGCTLRCLICAAMGWELCKLIDIEWLQNTAVCHFIFEDNTQTKMEIFGDISHLGGIQ